MINFFTIAFLYLSLSIGSFGLAEPDLARTGSMLVMFLFVVLTFPRPFNLSFFDAFIYCSLAAFLFLGLTRSHDLRLAINKIDGALLGSFLSFGLAKSAELRLGKRAPGGFVFFSLLILFFTFFYKVNFGLDDRTVRFFLNGPIVFGWLMVYASIMSITAFLALGSFYYLLFSGLFFCAVIWSASKGPLLSFFSGIISLFLLTRRFALLWVSFFFILSAFFLIRYGAMPDRLASIERFLLFENEQSDEGSVLLRQHMWRSSLDIIRERPLLGTGLGNWYFYTPVFSLAREVVYYPHNILLELLSEHGFIGFFYILFLFFAILTSSSSMLSRTLMVCGFTGLLFSGDLGYWHFLFGIPLAWRKLPY